MQFSLARLFLIVLFVGLLLGATFSLPIAIGYLVLLVLSMYLLPPIVIVGVIQTRGIRQSFFVGAMITGIPHFLFSVYYSFSIMSSLGSNESFSGMFDDGNEVDMIRIAQLIWILLGCLGGLSGMAAYSFFKMGARPNPPAQQSETIQVLN